MEKKPIVIVSGYFNPIHGGHIDMIRAAAELGEVIVVLNSDKQVKIKGSIPFMNQDERAYILNSVKGVTEVWISQDTDGTVCRMLTALEMWHRKRSIIFANGGDRKKSKDIPEAAICKKLGIKMVFNVGGKKTQSSSKLIAKAIKNKKK